MLQASGHACFLHFSYLGEKQAFFSYLGEKQASSTKQNPNVKNKFLVQRKILTLLIKKSKVRYG